MVAPLKGVDPGTLPWARSIENKLSGLERGLSSLGYNVNRIPDADKAVYAEFDGAQNINLGSNGKLALRIPTSVRYVTSTGQFEVTVSLGALVRDGALLGVSFEGEEFPSYVDNHLPRYGVVGQAPVGHTEWLAFSSSYSTIVSARPGVQELNLYVYAECIAADNSAGYIERAAISVKPV